MTKIVIKPKYPETTHILPVTLSMDMTRENRAFTITSIDSNFKKIEKWLNVERNYTT